jgi:predicted type IV restriction endonuclease
VTDFLYDALGYDKYTDLTTEYMVRGDFADYGIRIDKEMIAFIEVKRVATKLGSKHLKQVEMYAVNEGVEWVILTNGVRWEVYHITGGLPMILDLAIEVDILGDETPQKKADKLYYITKESLKKRQIDEVWKTKRATSPKALAQAIISPPVISAVQLALKKQSGHKIESDEIVRLLKGTVLRSECFDKG